MNSQPTTASAMTGFIIDNGRLYAVLQEPNGETSLYDRQALAWLISEARKTATKVPNFENALQVLTSVNIK